MIGRSASPSRSICSAAVGICVAVAVCAVAPVASAASVNIAGSYSALPTGGNTYLPLEINTDVLFDLSQGPVTVTGTVDFGGATTGLWANSSVFVGLISKDRYDAWIAEGLNPTDAFFGFLDDAYGVFNVNSSNVRIGLGQYRAPGEVAQTYVASQTVRSFTGFELTFDLTEMSLTYNSTTRQQAYADHRSHFDGQTIPTDWSSGAYAFVGTWFDTIPTGADPGRLQSPNVNVTFTGPEAAVVPVPAAAGLMLLGMGGVALRRLRSRKS